METIDVHLEFPEPPESVRTAAVAMWTNASTKFGAVSSDCHIDPLSKQWNMTARFNSPEDAAQFAAMWAGLIGKHPTLHTKVIQ